jgi:hypothetical protein
MMNLGYNIRRLVHRIHRRAARDHPLSERQKSANTTRSKVRAVSSTHDANGAHNLAAHRVLLLAEYVHPLECAHGWTPCGIVQRTARTPARRQNGPRSGTHLGTSAATARSAKAEIAESEYCSRFP